MTSQGPAIVLAYGLNGLGAVRSLGVAGIPVIAIGGSSHDSALRSRYATERVVMDRKLAPEERFRAALEPFAGRSYPVIATSDPAASFLCRNAEELSKSFAIVSPPPAAMAAFLDKQLEYELLSSAQIPMPVTVTCIPATGSSLATNPGLPLIIKPRTLEDSHNFGFKNLIVRNNAELDDALRRIGDHIERFVAQSIIEGTDDTLWVCNATFGQRHEMLCGMTFRRLGLSPPHFGVTSLAVSETQPRVRELSEKLGKLYEWVGPCMLEFKWDSAIGDFVYIETNPRLGMCNWFDTRVGVNNVLANYLLALGRESEVQDSRQHDGWYFISLFPDLVSRLDDKEPFLSIISRYIKLLRQHRIGAWWYWRDPIPGVANAVQNLTWIITYPIRRLKHRIRNKSRHS